MLFSQRQGLKSASKVLQLQGMDDDLRNGLWSGIYDLYLAQFNGMTFIQDSNFRSLFQAYWLSYFKKPTDTMPQVGSYLVKELRAYFFGCKWHEAYDFLEFSVSEGPSYVAPKLRSFSNYILERENSGFRFVSNEIVPISNSAEIDAIESAATTALSAVNTHIQNALALLADRKHPDYRNSIKEAISAVESTAKLISHESKASLKPALDALNSAHPIHPALRKAFESLYGYTSDAHGIRHALLEEPSLDFTDAKFMLVACSAFVNYLLGKSA